MSDNLFRRKSIAYGFLNGFPVRNVMILWQNCICWSCRVRSIFCSLFSPECGFFRQRNRRARHLSLLRRLLSDHVVYFGNVHSFNYVIISVFSSFFTIFAR